MVRSLGVGATFSGAALVMHILIGVSLRFALVVAGALVVLALAVVWRRAAPPLRQAITRRAGVGLVAGVLALVAYDASKWALSQLDPSPYNPFEAVRAFGLLLVGEAQPGAIVLSAGAGFHVLNGVCFGIAFVFLFGYRGVLAGMVWGVFLETFQLALYPGWLGTELVAEFVQISAASHLVYGATLGLVCKNRLRAEVAAMKQSR